MLAKKASYVVAVVGATGAVGQEMIFTLEQRNFPVSQLRCFASERSAGRMLEFKGGKVKVEPLTMDSFRGIDIALFSAGGDRSTQWAPVAAKSGCVVIDNSNAWRMDPEVPLVVPEVNPQDIKGHKGIIANPNCSTIQMVVVLKPIHDKARIKRVVVSTYQSVSGTGMKAMEELGNQTAEILNMKEPTISVYPRQIAFNLLPHIDVFLDNGYTREEMKMVNETRKIMGDDTIRLTVTTVRTPVFRCHSECLNIETERKLTPNEARALRGHGRPGQTRLPHAHRRGGQGRDLRRARARGREHRERAEHVDRRGQPPQGRGPQRGPDRREARGVRGVGRLPRRVMA